MISICEHTSADLPIFVLMDIYIESMNFFSVMNKVAQNLDSEEWNFWVTEFGMCEYRMYCHTASQSISYAFTHSV